MSVKVMSAVIDHSKTEGATFVVLLMLADHANAEGLCWPSLDRIARRARVSRSTVKRAVDELVAVGELERQRGGRGVGSTNVYLVMPSHVDNSDLPVQKGFTLTPLRGSSARIRGSSARNKGFTGEPQTVRNHQEPRASLQDIVEDPDPDVVARVAEVRAQMKKPDES